MMEAERQKTLQSQFASDGPLRPILTSLNGDNSWLLSFPRPEEERSSTGKAYCHIVFEPWLNGPTSLFTSWVIHLQQTQTPALGNPEAINAAIRQIETAASSGASTNGVANGETDKRDNGIDAIFLGFHYLDHVHEPTLRLFDASIPVIGTPEAIAIVKPWNHFTTIKTISNFDSSATSWRDEGLHPGSPFPSWLTPLRLLGHHELNYVTVLIWSHSSPNGSITHEAILQTPHGTKLDVGPLEAFLASSPPTQKLALLHGLKESRAGGSMNTYGAAGGLALYRKIGGAKYWVSTHSSPLAYSGVVMRLLWVNDTPRTVDWALEQESKEGGKEGGKPDFREVRNGDCLVLV
ncbi:hypothetical protein H2200_011158 [Cladophialophora chaetospira]|uniref:Uncharacterized protein n=1 Tax=Cladophialophora chaetospira TaxID=386627 RepID=A0AA39CDJ8_9EURO|nr:hypothetical protein H2200_011158 [Cladophialophora chaetospira]